MKLLLAEDEVSMSEALVDILTYHHYTVDPVFNGQDALDYAQTGSYDGIILDIMMPLKDGLEVLDELRQSGDKTPILMLTAKSDIEDRIHGLNLGADDYLPKPFAMGEFLARVRAMLRRRETFTPDLMQLGNITLNRNNYELSGGGQSFLLSNLEFKLMELFMLNKGIYLSSEKILQKVWGYDTDAEVGVVWVYISYLRKRLLALNSNVEIKVKRGIGYTLEVRP
ncbi:response regulator transcription factor [[Clostridium] leptum]|nr:response regulator transcription factor [[Clostridium] leptum]CZT57698.1 Response regulator ArlR [Eubacteriaceae bacterium CHKCI005]